MCKIILFRIIQARNQITKLFTVTWNACYYEELEPRKLQNTKTSTTFSKISKHFKKEKVNLSDLTSKFILFRIESMFCKTFPKNTSQYFSIYLHHSVFTLIIHHQYFLYLPSYIIIQIKRQIWPCLFYGKVGTFSKFTLLHFMCIILNSYPSDFIIPSSMARSS